MVSLNVLLVLVTASFVPASSSSSSSVSPSRHQDLLPSERVWWGSQRRRDPPLLLAAAASSLLGRGGGTAATEDGSYYKTVSTIHLSNNDSTTTGLSSGCLLIPMSSTEDVSEESSSPTDAAAFGRPLHYEITKDLLPLQRLRVLETLATVSDVLVVVVSSEDVVSHDGLFAAARSADTATRLLAGWERRRQAAVQGQQQVVVFLVVLDDDDEASDRCSVDRWRERMVGSDCGVALLDSGLCMEVVVVVSSNQNPVEALSRHVTDILSSLSHHNQEATNLIEPRGFCTLVQQVYQTLGRRREETTNEEEDTLQLLRESDTVPLTIPFQGEEDILISDSAPTTANDSTDTDESLVAMHPEEKASAEDSVSAPENDDLLLLQVQEQLNNLQARQEQYWLDGAERMPMDFGREANAVLIALLAAHHSRLAPWSAADVVAAASSEAATSSIASRLQQLHQQHLQSLRDYYGRVYEAALDEERNEDDDDDGMQSVAATLTNRFQQAATASVPELARQGNVFYSLVDFEYLGSLQGLVSDMMQATVDREDLLLENVKSDSESGVQKPAKRPAKWYEKLAARALMLGVNYVQGWLAWQGVKRAALERERNLPKFPLF